MLWKSGVMRYGENKKGFNYKGRKMIIRQEESKDYEIVEAVVKKAFENAEHSDGKEHELVARLRKSDGFIKELSLVAEEDNSIIGHIVFTKARIGDDIVLALAPLSVLPSAQKKGVGTALMRKGHEIAKRLGYDIIVVLGSEKYYPRVGYKPASTFEIKAPFEVPDENFMAISLSDNGEKVNGTIEYVKEILEG